MASRAFGTKGPSRPHLVRGRGGVAGQVADLRLDVDQTFDELESGGVLGDPVAALQTTWYVDSINGNDSNDGKTEATALEHLSEYFRRVNGTVTMEAVTIQLLADNTDPFVISAGFAPAGLIIQGIRTVVATGTLKGVQAYVHTSGSAQRGEITDTGIDGTGRQASFTPHVNRRIILTSGTEEGGWAWILEDINSESCVVSPWLSSDGWSEITPSINDGYEVVTQSTLTGMYARGTADPFLLQDLKVQGAGSALWMIQAAYAKHGNLSLHGCEVTSPTEPTYGKVGGEWGFVGMTGCLLHDFIYDHAFQTVFMLLDFYGCAIVGMGWGNDNSHNDSWEFWSIPSVAYAPGTEDVSAQIVRSSQLVLSTALGILTSSKTNAVRLESTTSMVVRATGAIWELGGSTGFGVSISSGAQLVWSPTSKTASQKFQFDSADNDFLFNGTGKSLAEVGGGYVDLVADPDTGVITGSGARATSNDDVW